VGLASLWWTKVFARGRCAWAGATSLLNAQGATLDDFALKTLLGSIGLLSSDHLHESEATRLLGMGVKHDLALLDVTIFLKQTSDFLLIETRVDAGNKKIGTWVDRAIISWRRTTCTAIGGTDLMLGHVMIHEAEY
jgi:hypothetical protein